MGKTKTGKVAIACTVIGFIFVVIAFTTPNWLETDEKLDSPKFRKIGKIFSYIFYVLLIKSSI